MKDIKNIKERIQELDELLKKKFLKDKNSLNILKERTIFFDDLICEILDGEIGYNLAKDNFFVAAVGGYGRKEVYPKSDIDIVIVHKKCEEDLLSKIYDKLIISLIDGKIDVGYSYRYFKDLPENIETELSVVTSLLDIRFLYGSYRLFDLFTNNIFLPYIKRNRKKYAKLKMEEYNQRLEKYNDSPYILEPNIKEGIGGLRDFHYIIWLSKVLFSFTDIDSLSYVKYLDDSDLKKLKEAYLFLSQVRVYTHFYHYLNKEKLSFDLQQEVANFLEYKDSSKFIRVEHFMSDYYRHTHNVYLVTSKVFHQLSLIFKKGNNFIRKEVDRGIYIEGFGEGEINILPKVVNENPRLIMKAFYYAKNLRKNLSFKTINLVQNLTQEKRELKWDEELKTLFFKIIAPDNLFTKEVLKDMYNSDFFQFLFPEFIGIHHKMQFDAYHIYTIDTHTIIAMSKLVDLYVNNVDEIKKHIKQPHLLSLAVFLHDIGKGEGKEHAKRGAVLSEQILKRMDLDFKERELLIFLVKNHLLLSHIAQRRDISDVKFLRKVFNEVIKNKENLYYLYFLTLVDLMAVGEGVWNSWKNKLLKTLLNNFENVSLSEKDYVEQEIKIKRDKIIKKLQENEKTYLINIIDILPEGYILNTDIEDILKYIEIDYELIKSGKEYVLKVIQHENENYVEIVIATKDEKGLFYQLSGIFTFVGFNILSANINTRKNGNVLDIFMVDLGSKDFEYDKNMFLMLDEYLRKFIINKEKIDKLVSEKTKRYHKKSIFKEKNEVFFDNVSSEKYTIIEVYAQDHMGLLFEITKMLHSLNLDIYFSRIATLGDRAVDVFYVLKDNQKISNEQELEHIKNAILKSISFA